MRTGLAVAAVAALLGACGCAQVSFEAGGTRGEAGSAAPRAVATKDPEPAAVNPVDTPLPKATHAPAAAPNQVPDTPAAVSVGEEDPNTRVRVASWWKLGGTPGSLDADMDACVTDLGPDHRPEAGGTLVSGALRDCLRERGWRAVGASTPP